MWKWVYRYRERNFPNDPLRLPEQPYNRKTTAQVCHLFLSSTMFSPISRMYSCLLPLLFLFLFLLWQDKGGTQKKRSLRQQDDLSPLQFSLPFSLSYLVCRFSHMPRIFSPAKLPLFFCPQTMENSWQTFFRFACNSSSLQRRWKQRKKVRGLAQEKEKCRPQVNLNPFAIVAALNPKRQVVALASGCCGVPKNGI